MFKIKPNFTRSEAIAKTVKTGYLIGNTYSLIKMIGSAITIGIVIVLFVIFGLPWYLGALFMAILAGIIVLKIVYLKRISSVRIK